MASIFRNIIRRVSKVSGVDCRIINVESKIFFLQVPVGILNTSNPSNILRNLSVTSVLQRPRVQHLAPEFKGMAVINEQFKEINLSDYKGKYVVLFFYPLDL